MHGKPHTPPRESRAFQHDERIAARKGIDMLAPKHKGATQRPRGKKGLVVQSATGGACEPSPRMLRGCRRIRETQRNADPRGGYTKRATSRHTDAPRPQ